MVRVRAPTNIAILKYWGKTPEWEKWHLPTKSSLSFTVSGFYTTTELEVEKGKGEVFLNLNGEDISREDKKFKNVQEFIEKLSELFGFVKEYNYYIKTSNNFPTAAGFASSASAFAALGRAIVEAVPEFNSRDERTLSVIARLGSGSASRSSTNKGGFVLWERGISPKLLPPPSHLNFEEKKRIIFSSYSKTLIPPEEFEDLEIIYGVVSAEEKKVKSRGGMKQSIATDPLYWEWVDFEESNLKTSMIELVKSKNWQRLFELIMIASNGLHASCLRTNPPIKYLNDKSWEVIDFIHSFNEKEVRAAYTFDAGPNPILFTTKENKEELLEGIKEILGEENIIPTKVGGGVEVE